MKMRFFKITLLMLIISMASITNNFAAKLDPTIPSFNANALALSSDGTASFTAPDYGDNWKKFDIQLMVRMSTMDATAGTIYGYKTKGSIYHIDPTETEYSFEISSTGYYQFQIRGVNLEGNYGEWVAIYDNDT